MYDEDDDDDTLDFSALMGRGFAALPGRTKESIGSSVYDDVASSIRTAYGRPMSQMAEGQYTQQSGALDQLAQRYGVQRTKADDSEKWLSVAAALFAPTETGKTSESLAKALGVYAGAKGAERKEERETSLALAKLMQRIESDAMRAEALGVRAARAAAKDAKPRYTYDPYSQSHVQIPGTGGMPDLPQPVAVEEVELPLLTPEQVAAIPAGSGVRFRTADGREGTR